MCYSVTVKDELESLFADGYTTTVVLDCGCSFRLNQSLSDSPVKVGDYFGCQRHSEVYGYDPKYGHELVNRDRRVSEIRDEP